MSRYRSRQATRRHASGVGTKNAGSSTDTPARQSASTGGTSDRPVRPVHAETTAACCSSTSGTLQGWCRRPACQGSSRKQRKQLNGSGWSTLPPSAAGCAGERMRTPTFPQASCSVPNPCCSSPVRVTGWQCNSTRIVGSQHRQLDSGQRRDVLAARVRLSRRKEPVQARPRGDPSVF